eukprot:334419-Chlamydomonas_euryale.AAC.1
MLRKLQLAFRANERRPQTQPSSCGRWCVDERRHGLRARARVRRETTAGSVRGRRHDGRLAAIPSPARPSTADGAPPRHAWRACGGP